MNAWKQKPLRTVTATVLAAVTVVSMAACGSESGSLSGAPGGGKWVDSDVVGTVTESSEIRLQDDFAAAVNQDWIVNATYDPNKQSEAGASNDAGDLVLDRFLAILDDESVTGANAELLRKFRDLSMDWDTRNKLGVEPLRKYLDEIEKIESIDDLTDYQASVERNPFGIGLMMPKGVESQDKDVSLNTLKIGPPTYSLGDKSMYLDFDATALAAKEQNDTIVTHFLSRLGYEDSDIKRILKENYSLETTLARSENEYGAHETFNIVQTDREKIAQYLNGYPLLEIVDGRGYSDCNSFNADVMFLSGLSGLYNEAHLSEIKSFLIVKTINATDLFYDKESLELVLRENVSKTKKSTGFYMPSDEFLFQTDMTNAAFLPAMEQLYLDCYVDDEMIAAYTQITEDLVEAYRVMLNEEDWLSDETKQAAIEKLNAMAIHVCRPDNVADYSDVTIKSYEEDGTLLDAMAEGIKFYTRHLNEIAAEERSDRFFWDIYDNSATTTMVNAFYMPSKNAIFICAGWAAIPEVLYGEDPSYEQMLGIVGMVVGHEISHGFDADGSHFDKNGRVYDDDGNGIDWMEAEDRSHLSERAGQLSSYYSLARPIPGKKTMSGELVKNEAMADMGGIKAVLYLAKNTADFDYDQLFRAYAGLWTEQTLEEYELLKMGDVHPLNFYRINIGLQQFDEFIETYGIEPGDGMYLAPERRVNVW